MNPPSAMRAAYPFPQSQSFHVGGGVGATRNPTDLLSGSCRVGISNNMALERQRAFALGTPMSTPQTVFRGVSPRAAPPSMFQWPTSQAGAPMTNVRAFPPEMVPQIAPQKGPAMVVPRENSNHGPSGIRVGATRLQQAVIARPMASQLRLKSPEALALDRNYRAAATGAGGRLQGQGVSLVASARKREGLPVNSPQGGVNDGGITRAAAFSRALASAPLTKAALPAHLTNTGWATTGGSGNTAVYRPIGRSAEDAAKSLAGKDDNTRRASDLTGAAQTDTSSPVFVATASDGQAEAPIVPNAGRVGTSTTVPLQLEQPVTDTTVTVVAVEDLDDNDMEGPRTLPQQQEARKPTSTSCCFGFLRRKSEKKR